MPRYREDMQQRLYPNLYRGVAYFYKESNPAQAEILRSPQMQAVVADYTSKVLAAYIGRIAPRSKSGRMLDSVNAEVFIGGFKNDRWVGEVRVEVEYAMADEFGRDEFDMEHGDFASGASITVGGYEGSRDLRDALYGVLPTAI